MALKNLEPMGEISLCHSTLINPSKFSGSCHLEGISLLALPYIIYNIFYRSIECLEQNCSNTTVFEGALTLHQVSFSTLERGEGCVVGIAELHFAE